MTRTSVTVPNWPKYSLSFSGVVCHDSPPTKSLPGAESEEGVLRPEEDPFTLPESPPWPGDDDMPPTDTVVADGEVADDMLTETPLLRPSMFTLKSKGNCI